MTNQRKSMIHSLLHSKPITKVSKITSPPYYDRKNNKDMKVTPGMVHLLICRS